jgi:ubiquinone/menaquinone biosynthesis C-methylase UbiE
LLPLYLKHVPVAGIYISTVMLARAQARVNRGGLDNIVWLYLMDAENIALTDSTFDKNVACMSPCR